MINNIYFYFPYHEDSGVPILFSRLANFLAKNNPHINISVIDYLEGVMSRNIEDLDNICIIPFNDDQNVVFSENSILILQSDVPYYWPKNLIPLDDTILFFWNLHPRNFVPSLLPFPFLRELPYNHFKLYTILYRLFYFKLINRLKNFIELLNENNALVYMDVTNYNFTAKHLFLEKKKVIFLQVPVNSSHDKRKIIDEFSKDLNFCWIGRLCDFKSYILVYTINKLSEIALSKKTVFNFFIIGDGPFKNYIQQEIKANEYFNVKFIGSLPNSKIDGFLLQNVDILTGMGTSALEGAKLGIPTILLDFSYRKINKDYIFRWLYNTEGFDLGHQIGEDDFQKDNNSLHLIVESIMKNYNEEANKSFLYFKDFHSINKVANKFLTQVNRSKLRFGMINKLHFEKPSLLKMYNKIRKINT